MPPAAAGLFDLSDRTVLVTGAASGLGRAFALRLSSLGATLACVDIDPAVSGTASAIAERGGRASAYVADLAQPGSVTELAGAVAADHDGLDVLVNNAGIAIPPARLPDVAVADWDRVIAANLRSVFLVSQAFLPMLLRRQTASVINVSSFLGLVGLFPGYPATAIPYAASKAGVIGFTKQFAIEYAQEGLRVNAIAPGWHGGTQLGRERRATASAEELERHEAFLKASIPVGRRGTPDELTGLVVYLASDESRYVTGQVFAHDGGLTAA